METSKKVLYFDYVVTRLIDWHVEETGIEDFNDLSRLKVMQLLYFITSADIVCGSSLLAAKIFTNFCVMKYGHVESDIYGFMNVYNGHTYSYHIGNEKGKGAILYQQPRLDYLLEVPMRAIDKAIAYLKQTNEDLIRMEGSDFIHLSRRWDSWQEFMGKDRTHNRGSYSIPFSYMLGEEKKFRLSQ